VQIFPFDIFREQTLLFAPITSLLTDDNSLRLAQNAILFALALFEKENKGSRGAGHLV